MRGAFQNDVPKASSDWAPGDNPGVIGITPRQAVERECSRHGQAAVVAGCVRLLRCRDDPVPRVRAAAERAVTALATG
jgi:hypothetical protein